MFLIGECELITNGKAYCVIIFYFFDKIITLEKVRGFVISNEAFYICIVR